MTEAQYHQITREDFNLRKRRPTRTPTHSRTLSLTPPKEASKTTRKRKAKPKEESRRDLPENMAEFEKEYAVFRRENGDRKELGEREMMLAYRMLTEVCLEGGIEKVLAEGEWSEKVKRYQKEYPLFTKTFSHEEFLELYLEWLLEFEYYLQGKSLTMRHGVTPRHTYLEPAIIRDGLTEALGNKKKGLSYYAQDIVVLRGGLD